MKSIKRHRGALRAALAVALAVAVAGAARADAETMTVQSLTVVKASAKKASGKSGKKGKKKKAKKSPKNMPPQFRAVVTIGRPGLTAAQFSLKDAETDPPVTVQATKLVPYKQSKQPMALVILVQGNFRWMGNETYTDPSDPNAGAIYNGAFKGLGPAIDSLAKAGPQGSEGALDVYADGKVLQKQPMGPASKLGGSALGSQQDYSQIISRPFIVGLTEAWKTLANANGHRKILVVFGDGNDDNANIASQLNKAIDNFKSINAEVYTVHYSPVADEGPQGQANMRKLGYSGHYAATSQANFRTFADSIVELIGSRYYVTFPGKGITFDGKSHELVVAVGKTESEPIQVKLPVWAPPKPKKSSRWWLWLLIVLVVVVVIVVVVVRLRRREPAPPPQVEAPPAPAPAAPQKTMMLGVGGNEDAMPIVGWIVPISGPQQYQTFKLLQGQTKLGTGGEAHILVQDQFMSTVHAEILCSPVGFTLNDLQSTNGTYVNEMRIQSHELVDNDVFTLGKTEFKFKSIN